MNRFVNCDHEVYLFAFQCLPLGWHGGIAASQFPCPCFIPELGLFPVQCFCACSPCI